MQKVKSWLRLGGIVGAVSGRLRSGKMAITDDFKVTILSVRFSSIYGEFN